MGQTIRTVDFKGQHTAKFLDRTGHVNEHGCQVIRCKGLGIKRDGTESKQYVWEVKCVTCEQSFDHWGNIFHRVKCCSDCRKRKSSENKSANAFRNKWRRIWHDFVTGLHSGKTRGMGGEWLGDGEAFVDFIEDHKNTEGAERDGYVMLMPADFSKPISEENYAIRRKISNADGKTLDTELQIWKGSRFWLIGDPNAFFGQIVIEEPAVRHILGITRQAVFAQRDEQILDRLVIKWHEGAFRGLIPDPSSGRNTATDNQPKLRGADVPVGLVPIDCDKDLVV